MATPTWLKPKFSGLEDCVAIAAKVSVNAGGDASEEEFSKIIDISLTSSYFNLALNSVRAYGLLDYANGRIRLTSLGEKVTTPADANELSTALLTAIRNFTPFKSLAERYQGKGEPEKQFILNLLQSEKKVKQTEIPQWADCFLRSARFAGLFNKTASLIDGVKMAQTVIVPGISEDKSKTNSGVLNLDENKPGWLTYPVPVPSGMAKIVVPEDLSRSAWEKLKKLLDAIEPAKEDLKK